jgi:glucokinase
MAVIGLDLGGTKLSGAIIGSDGSMTGYSSLAIGKRTGEAVGDLIVHLINELNKRASSENITIESIGCCVPGIVYKETGLVWVPNIKGWDNFALVETIRKNHSVRDIRISIDNDRACSIMGEIWLGSAKGCKNAIFLAVGTGIGAGIVSDGRIIRGNSDIAGAVGWLALNQPFMDKYISVGCFEYNASGEGLARVAKEFLQNDKKYKGILRSIDRNELTAHDVFNAYETGDYLAVKILSQAICYWGMAVANLVSIFNPEKIIFGGGVFGPAGKFLDDIMSEAKKWAQPISIRQVSLSTSALGNNAGLIGSAYLAMTDY